MNQQFELNEIWEHAVASNNYIAVWSIPNTTKYVFISGKAVNIISSKTKIGKLGGYLMFPFSIGKKPYLLLPTFRAEFNFSITTCIKWEGEIVPLTYPKRYDLENVFIEGEINFKKRVMVITEDIKMGNIQKVVIARQKQVPLPDGFQIMDFFLDLCKAQKSAFKSLFYTPNTGIWVGASPELLCSIDKMGELKMSSLAGTMHIQDKFKMRKWGAKELNEQKIVTDFLIERVKKIAKSQIKISKLKTIRAGQLLHLETKIRASLPPPKSLAMTLKYVKTIHPTPAMCGFPQARAINIIKNLEPIEREYYSGFWGPISKKNEVELYANIRCMKISNSTGILYAGCGITNGSNPDKEWIETEKKLETLQSIIH